MKVYVDELPKGAIEYGCDNCPYAEILGIKHYIINGKSVDYRDCVCKLDKTYGFGQGTKRCPLQPIAKYTKQVRKEVCDEIREIADIDDWEEINGYTLEKILDQIQSKES